MLNNRRIEPKKKYVLLSKKLVYLLFFGKMGCGASSAAAVVPHSPATADPRSAREYSNATLDRTVTQGVNSVEVVSPAPLLFSLSPGSSTQPPEQQPLPTSSEGGQSTAAPASEAEAAPGSGAEAVEASTGSAQEQVHAAVDRGGAAAVMALMATQPSNVELQCWCCDALAGLMSGAEEVRQACFAASLLPTVLGLMAGFPYSDELQTRACWVLAAMAASYSAEIGASGGLEACVRALQTCPESYSLLTAVVRALTNLVTALPSNAPKAVALGACSLLQTALADNSADGQLQWRGKQLISKLESAAAAAQAESKEAAAAAAPEPAATAQQPAAAEPAAQPAASTEAEAAPPSAAGPLGGAADSGQGDPDLLAAMVEQLIAAQAAQLPGQEGSSLVVANALKSGGVRAVCTLLASLASELEGESPGSLAECTPQQQAHLDRSAETAYWCCDALYTAAREDKAVRRAAVLNDCLASVFSLLKSRCFDERLTVAGLTALQAFAGDLSFSEHIGEGLPQIVQHLEANRTSPTVQQASVKLISLLLMDRE